MSGNKAVVVLMCRVCTRACKDYKTLKCKIDIGRESSTTVAEMLTFCVGLSYEPQDGAAARLPQQICMECLLLANNVYILKRKVGNNELLRLGLKETDEVIGEVDADDILDIEREEHLLTGDSQEGEDYLDDSMDETSGNVVVSASQQQQATTGNAGGEVLCEVCGETTSNRSKKGLNVHMRVHNKKAPVTATSSSSVGGGGTTN
ncbi:uncharacterized protein LOC132798854 [Drosophila nasuta]|uniref:uncharacterized protein LOC132798854 n=1 Tax=Drosophila nasuta TaxID=42062 RepID=UPI00295F3282|nr:uncharacterized protein LOC132798854 [Drosophila nasuta]